jgi:hypothetical protein
MTFKVMKWEVFWRHFKKYPFWAIKWWMISLYGINFGIQQTDEELEIDDINFEEL